MFANNLMLCKLIFRRDRFHILIWFVCIAALVVGFGAALPGLFDTEESREAILPMMENPAMVAMIGPVYTTPDGGFSLGAMYALFMLVWSAICVAFMNIFHVVRHTRQDEEQGRIEVIRSLPVGRLANLSATLTSALIINAGFALLLGLGLGIVGSEDMTFSGAMLFGAAMGAAGMVFAAATAVFCQLSQSPRTAMSLSFLFLGAAYLLRAAGDLQGNDVLACVSPLGIISRAKPYLENSWWPILVLLLVGLLLAVLAFRLCGARDMGAGMVAARPGRKDAAPYLKSPIGLAWRLLRTPVIVWAAVITLLSMSYGSIMGDIDAFIKSISILEELTGGDQLRMMGFLMVIMSICAAVPMLQFVLRARSEESHGYAEHLI
ncbi:MAG: ABC transporter permease, partial [Clostridiales bacterium]|nr:ABC transporter permease [Clostridiales bacterium]